MSLQLAGFNLRREVADSEVNIFGLHAILHDSRLDRQTQYLVILCLIGAGVLGIVWRAMG